MPDDPVQIAEYAERYLEQLFLLMYYCGFGYEESKRLPIYQREWFIKRINAEFERARNNNEDTQSKAAHQNTPEMRELQGRARSFVPAKLRRFT